MSWYDFSLIIMLALQCMIEGQIMEPFFSEQFHSFSWVFLCSASVQWQPAAQTCLHEQHVLRQSLWLYPACLFSFLWINPLTDFLRQRREKNNLETKLLKIIQYSREECDFGGLYSCLISLEDFNPPDYTGKGRDFKNSMVIVRRENKGAFSLSRITHFCFLPFMWFYKQKSHIISF